MILVCEMSQCITCTQIRNTSVSVIGVHLKYTKCDHRVLKNNFVIDFSPQILSDEIIVRFIISSLGIKEMRT